MTESAFYKINYEIKLHDGEIIDHTVEINPENMESNVALIGPPPDWVRLDNEKCDQCTLVDTEYCPIALRLVEPMRKFNRLISHHKTITTVTTADRTYIKEVDVQEALRSLFGLIMATSGCPVMRPFKYMARYHLPFSSMEETVSRITATYLLRQLVQNLDQPTMPIDLKELGKLYDTMQILNSNIAKRLRKGAQNDGAINAVVILSIMTSMVPITVQEELKKINQLL